uniref:ATP synthase F0 subunit 8 n=1 Tax=Chlorophorus annularis TaxID=2586298 RepID=UPI001EF9D1DF|nr:ATP synthase F0 subunit 8 [Chlorophorus annularis]ULA45453.1 ATP synthase F0 subunit 8 [Chlorophorus annularis]
MPQMAPLNWLLLFTFFSIIFLLFNSMNYYSFLYSPKETKSVKMQLNFNWKW